jgi:hypothetical protein
LQRPRRCQGSGTGVPPVRFVLAWISTEKDSPNILDILPMLTSADRVVGQRPV